MSDVLLAAETREIVVEEHFPHAVETIWKALTSGALIARWMMTPTGFEPVEGCRFTFQTTPAGPWDGVIACEVLEVRPRERFAYSWKGGHESNVGYGSKLSTVVTFQLAAEAGGTRLRVVHAGFELPRNATAFKSMGDGWRTIVPRITGVLEEQPARRGGGRRCGGRHAMSRRFTGGCACGQLRYAVEGEPVVMVDCQCRACQRESGTGHTSNVTFSGAAVSQTGAATIWEAVGDQGMRKASAFCPTCGSPVTMTFPDMPDLFVVRAASLDDPTQYAPQIVTWTASAQPWDRVDAALPAFSRMPLG